MHYLSVDVHIWQQIKVGEKDACTNKPHNAKKVSQKKRGGRERERARALVGPSNVDTTQSRRVSGRRLGWPLLPRGLAALVSTRIQPFDHRLLRFCCVHRDTCPAAGRNVDLLD